MNMSFRGIVLDVIPKKEHCLAVLIIFNLIPLIVLFSLLWIAVLLFVSNMYSLQSFVLVLTSGWDPCWICWEVSNQAGEEHWWPRRYGPCFPYLLKKYRSFILLVLSSTQFYLPNLSCLYKYGLFKKFFKKKKKLKYIADLNVSGEQCFALACSFSLMFSRLLSFSALHLSTWSFINV